MKQKLHKISETNCDVYISWSSLFGDYKFCGFILKKDPKIYYHNYVSDKEDLIIPEGYVGVEIETCLLNFYKQLAYEELQVKIEESVHDYNFTQMENKRSYIEFWHNAVRTAGEEKKPNNLETFMSLHKDGVMSINLKGDYIPFKDITCVYDFNEIKHVEYQINFNKKILDITAMDIFYSRDMNAIMALEQYKIGIASKVYNELALLNEFMHNTKEITVSLKNGDKCVYSSEWDCRNLISSEYNQDEGKMTFHLCSNRAFKKYVPKKTRIPISELDFIQVGENKHYIDASAFDMPNRIKDSDVEKV